ncbi:MAG: ribosome maturation factor RimM [bacterium]|nr:ribosome maturation factor RimM [bacterium]
MKARPEFVSIGIVTKPHGTRGEIQVNPITEELQQFKTIKQVYLKMSQGERAVFTIEYASIRNDKVVLKLEGINNRTDADNLKGSLIEKHFDLSATLLSDEYYIFDLIGLNVKTADNRWLGKITEVLSLPANDVYVVQNGTEEYLIPAIKDVIKFIDLEAEIMLIQPIEGLL